jgi:hypothetical protein
MPPKYVNGVSKNVGMILTSSNFFAKMPFNKPNNENRIDVIIYEIKKI